MKDNYRYLMKREPEYKYRDVLIERLTLDGLMRFADAESVFTQSFDVTMKANEALAEVWVLSLTAAYESAGEAIPTAQVRLIDDGGATLYYSPVYEIGKRSNFYRREWRIPPTIDRFDTVRISFMIPSGVRLRLKSIKAKANTRYRESECGIRYHGHAGFPGYAPDNSAFGFQMAAEMGFASCITIPKFTKDGVGVCFHDDETVRGILRYDDGSLIEEGSEYDKPIREFEYAELLKLDAGIRMSDIYEKTRIPTLDSFFRICSMTGMSPIFSVHPSLTRNEWEYVRELLIKYRLLDKFWIKSDKHEDHRLALELFDDSIGGYIMIQPIKATWDPAEYAKACGFDRNRHRVTMEFFYVDFNEDDVDEKIRKAKAEGFNVSVAAMCGGVSGVAMQRLINLGVSEFTLDYHCSTGLDW